MSTKEKPVIIKKPTIRTGDKSKPKAEDIYQVVLHNDDAVAAEHVVQCLITVFKHQMTMACKIMMEAHKRGRSIAEVEGKVQAERHCAQLQSARLTVTMEKV